MARSKGDNAMTCFGNTVSAFKCVPYALSTVAFSLTNWNILWADDQSTIKWLIDWPALGCIFGSNFNRSARTDRFLRPNWGNGIFLRPCDCSPLSSLKEFGSRFNHCWIGELMCRTAVVMPFSLVRLPRLILSGLAYKWSVFSFTF